MTYGEKISYLRKSKGMTQEELGKVFNVTYQAVSKWERGESLPDFNMMSQIAKFFQVPLSYFEEGGEYQETTTPAETAPTVLAVFAETAPAAAETNNIIGMCTECGKMLNESEVHTFTPKIICHTCAERLQRAEEEKQRAIAARKEAEEDRRRAENRRYLKVELGRGVDLKLIVSSILALVVYILITASALSSQDATAGASLVILPQIVYAVSLAIANFVAELRDRDDDCDGYNLMLSMIVSGGFVLVNIIVFLILYFNHGQNPAQLRNLAIGAVISLTFISQFTWGNFIKEFFTGGGITFKLPGFIFSLDIESILFMIIAKIVLGILSVVIFILTTVLCALFAMLASVLTFIPCLIYKTLKDRKAKKHYEI